MLNFLKKFLFKQKPFFKCIDGGRTSFEGFSLDQIRDRTTDGIIVRNFFDRKACQLMVERMREARGKVMANPDEVGMFPSTFSQIKSDSLDFDKELQIYFDRAKSFVDTFYTAFDNNPLEEITSFIEGINAGSKLNIIPGKQSGIYQPANFRIQPPEKNSIKLHCDNQFASLFPKYYQHLSSLVEVNDQLSYFIMLQEPDEGGRLIVYDLIWEEGQNCDPYNNTVTSLDGEVIDLNSDRVVKNEKLYIATGDLIIFGGGRRWHTVEEVHGTKSRITFGGCIGFDKVANVSDLYCWS